MSQQPGARWQTKTRAGMDHRLAGRKGGCASGCWSRPRSAETRQEAAMRWFMGDGTQTELAQEYGVSRSTIRRWCAALEGWVE